MKKTTDMPIPPYRRVTSSEVLNRLLQYGVFGTEEALFQVVEELAHAAREMRKPAKEHGGNTRLGQVIPHYAGRERAYVDEMRESLARLQVKNDDGNRSTPPARPRRAKRTTP